MSTSAMMKKKRTESVNRFSWKRTTLILALVLVLAGGCLVSNSVAWLVAGDDPYVNVFTGGQLYISLTGSQQNHQLIPGTVLSLDPAPTVTVPANSPSCYVFIKIKDVDTTGLIHNNAQIDYVGYNIAHSSNWTRYGGSQQDLFLNYYYVQVPHQSTEKTLRVFSNNELSVNWELPLERLQNLDAAIADGTKYAGLKIEACAVQTAGQTLESAYALALAQFEP